MKAFYLSLAYIFLFLLSACSKDGDTPEDGNLPPGVNLAGEIFTKTGNLPLSKFSLSTYTFSTVTADWGGSGWDISWNAKKAVKRTVKGNYETQYLIFDLSNGTTLKEIVYKPTGSSGGSPKISPDGNKLALRPGLRDGLIILDMNGSIIRQVAGYGSTHDFKYLNHINWEPNGTILFKKDGGLWRTSTDFGRATKVRDIPFDDWNGHAAASPDGRKIVLSGGSHIWLMNADGTDFHAVTQSAQEERFPQFSPDSKYIAMKANFSTAAEEPGSNKVHHICIIPADGQLYHVKPGADNRVIHPMEKGKKHPQGLGISVTGDFVWR